MVFFDTFSTIYRSNSSLYNATVIRRVPQPDPMDNVSPTSSDRKMHDDSKNTVSSFRNMEQNPNPIESFENQFEMIRTRNTGGPKYQNSSKNTPNPFPVQQVPVQSSQPNNPVNKTVNQVLIQPYDHKISSDIPKSVHETSEKIPKLAKSTSAIAGFPLKQHLYEELPTSESTALFSSKNNHPLQNAARSLVPYAAITGDTRKVDFRQKIESGENNKLNSCNEKNNENVALVENGIGDFEKHGINRIASNNRVSNNRVLNNGVSNNPISKPVSQYQIECDFRGNVAESPVPVQAYSRKDIYMAQHKYMYNKDTSTSSSLNYIDNNSVANSVLTSTQEDEIEKLKGLKALQNKLNNFDERESRNETTEV